MLRGKLSCGSFPRDSCWGGGISQRELSSHFLQVPHMNSCSIRDHQKPRMFRTLKPYCAGPEPRLSRVQSTELQFLWTNPPPPFKTCFKIFVENAHTFTLIPSKPKLTSTFHFILFIHFTSSTVLTVVFITSLKLQTEKENKRLYQGLKECKTSDKLTALI